MPLALNFLSIFAAHPSPGGANHTLPIFIGTLIVLAGLACDALILNRFLPDLRFRVTDKPWGLSELGMAVALLLGLFTFSVGAYRLLAWLCHRNIEDLSNVIIPAELVLRLTVLAGFAVYFRVARISLRKAIGLDVQPLRAAGWGILFGFASLPLVGIVIFVNNVIFHLLGIPTSDQAIVDVFLYTKSPFLLSTLVVFAVVVAPVCEGFIFRAFAYPALKTRFGMGPALVIISGVFALNHLHAPSLVPLFVLALGLGLAYELTGSLMAPIAMHSVFNSIMILQVFYQRTHPS